VTGTIKAASDAAFHRLVARFVGFYSDSVLDEHWGEGITFGADNTFTFTMAFQGMDEAQAASVWRPFLDWITSSPQDFVITTPIVFHGRSARDYWNAEFLMKNEPGRAFSDQRPAAPDNNIWFAEQNTELGAFWHGFQSVWLPASLLHKSEQGRFVNALFAATRRWAVSLHFNKGLAGASAADVAAAKDTAMNPAVLNAFALAIIGGAFPGRMTFWPVIPLIWWRRERMPRSSARLETSCVRLCRALAPTCPRAISSTEIGNALSGDRTTCGSAR
jgi:hypothetical protein